MAAFKYDMICAVLASGNVSRVYFITLPSQFYKEHSTVMDALDTIVFSSLVPALSLVVISVATAITCISLRRATTWRKQKVFTLTGGMTRKSNTCRGKMPKKGKNFRAESEAQISAVDSGISGENNTSKTEQRDQILPVGGLIMGSEASTNTSECSTTMTQKEVGLTRMLVVISVVYIVCVSPRVPRALSRLLVPEFRGWGSLCNLLLMTEAVMNVLLALNSALNFFVFYWLGSRYRTKLHQLFTGKTRRMSP